MPKTELKLTMQKIAMSGGNVDLSILDSLFENLHQSKVIQTIRTEKIAFGKSHCQVIELPNSNKELVSYNSFEENINEHNFRMKDVLVPNDFDAFMTKEYPEVIDLLFAALYCYFGQDKQTLVWLHANSDWGKTFFFHIPYLTYFLESHYDDNTFKGEDPKDIISKLFILIDEAEKITKQMKSTTLSYDRKYNGRETVKIALRILSSKEAIKDLSGGVDIQFLNRTTKMTPTPKDLKETLKSRLGKKFTPAYTKKIYDAWAIRLIRDEFFRIKKESEENIDKFNEIMSTNYTNFLNKYKGGLDCISLEEFAIDEVTDILNQSVEYNDVNKTGDEQYVTDTNQKLQCNHSDNSFSEFIIVDKKNRIYIKDVMKFREMFDRVRLGTKKYSFNKSISDNKSFASIFCSSEKPYKPRRINERLVQSILIECQYVIDESRFIVEKWGEGEVRDAIIETEL
jgi:hypothetical protein